MTRSEIEFAGKLVVSEPAVIAWSGWRTIAERLLPS